MTVAGYLSGAYKNDRFRMAALLCDMMVPPADARHLVRSRASKQPWISGVLVEFAASGLRLWL